MRRHVDEKVEWLASLPWWGELSRKELDLLASTADRVTVPAGRDLMHEGDAALEAAIVVDGEVEIRRDGELIARLGPGEVIGELGVIDRGKRNADVIAAVHTELLVLRSSDLRRTMDDSQHLRTFVQEAAARHRTPPATSGD